MELVPNFVSVSELQKNYAKILKGLLARPVFVLNNNKAQAVILSPQKYDDLINLAVLQENAKAQKAIVTYNKEKKSKKLIRLNSPEELFAN